MSYFQPFTTLNRKLLLLKISINEIKIYFLTQKMLKMKSIKFALSLIFFCSILLSLNGQNGSILEPDKACINCATPEPSAVLEVESTTKGILIPRMTSSQRTAISSPANGLLVYDTTTKSFWYNNTATGWKEMASGGSGGGGSDNLGNHTAIQNLSLNNNYLSNDGDNEGIRISNNGYVGIGTTTPTATLDVRGGIHTSNSMELNINGTGNRHTVIDFHSGSSLIDYDFRIWRGLGANGNAIFRNIGTGSYFFQNGSTDLMTIRNNGHVGIGTTTPERKLHILGGTDVNGANGGFIQMGATTGTNMGIDNNEIQSRNNGAPSVLGLNSSGGDVGLSASALFVKGSNGNVGIGTSSPYHRLTVVDQSQFSVDVSDSDLIKFGNFASSLDNLRMLSLASVEISIDDNNNTTNNFFRVLSDGNSELFRITEDGKVGVGTTTIPTAFKFAVAGNMIAEELRVELETDWPDYVFNNDYKLMPLPELESFIEAKGHLPNVPTAEKIEEQKGVDVGELQRTLLEKVEELTLYIIQINKENETLKKRVEELENK